MASVRVPGKPEKAFRLLSQLQGNTLSVAHTHAHTDSFNHFLHLTFIFHDLVLPTDLKTTTSPSPWASYQSPRMTNIF